MKRAVLERRLDAIAAEVATLQPKAPGDPRNEPFAWLAWVATGDLMWVEGVIERGNLGIEPTPEERAQWLALEADAIRRMLAGERKRRQRRGPLVDRSLGASHEHQGDPAPDLGAHQTRLRQRDLPAPVPAHRGDRARRCRARRDRHRA